MEVTEQPITLHDRVIARADAVRDRMLPHIPEWNRRITKLVQGHEPVRVRLRAFRKLVDEVTAHYGDSVACKAGCSHCCYIAVSVLQPEAELIGSELGIKPKKVKGDAPGEVPCLPFNYDNPCTFLKDDRCSIYEHRPTACRIYVSLHDTSEPCHLDAPHDVPQFDVNMLYEAYMMICVQGGRLPTKSDIRNFFPAKK